MAGKQLSLEQTQHILDLYEKYKTYAEVSRQVNISPPTVKRIIDAHTVRKSTPQQLCYNGDIPDEPPREQIKDLEAELIEFSRSMNSDGVL